MYETMNAMYEELDKVHPAKKNFECSHCEAYIIPTPQLKREIMVDVEPSGTTQRTPMPETHYVNKFNF